MNRSWKRDGLREIFTRQQLDRDPDSVREQMADEASRATVAVPECLSAPVNAKPWQVRAYADATALYRDIAVAGPGGIELRELGSQMGQDRRNSAVKVLRTSGSVIESREQRDAGNRELIVFRVAD